jgi:peptide chain release factor 1
VEWFSGTGKGGQHRNKKMNSCRLKHLPTGIVETRQGRKRESNLRDAKNTILQTLQLLKNQSIANTISYERKNQTGTGMRGDKIRTYRFQDDVVIDHQSGMRASCSKIMKGYFDLLWK